MAAATSGSLFSMVTESEPAPPSSTPSFPVTSQVQACPAVVSAAGSTLPDRAVGAPFRSQR